MGCLQVVCIRACCVVFVNWFAHLFIYIYMCVCVSVVHFLVLWSSVCTVLFLVSSTMGGPVYIIKKDRSKMAAGRAIDNIF